MTTYHIPFTLFHPPNGRQEETYFDTDAETFALWKKISLCIEEPSLGDFDCLVVFNGPAVPVAVRKMLERFDPAKLAEWKKAMS